ncbi:hypothetical protein [Methylicorpusculum sp.]|uniref:hypothetical protein n=1 Tax=Methylicorpusculum sp. TaxID=2713644 RepID=UPI0027164604|nr:hypothetical protein [Methylicorpusculum sp.]MDO8844131.1 hypothetical protein [Methylicorpusculum sp.]
MNEQSVTIAKQPAQKTAEDFFELRREGIGYIAEMGSRFWTDYNTHDPGITLLEALCYALTDLAYRSNWDIKDLLMPPPAEADPEKPFAGQAFFTARDILTVNPVTPDDFRRSLIDLDTVRNAWIFCKQCACDVNYYAVCENETVTLAYQKPQNSVHEPKKVDVLGLYDVLLELEADPELGDLNDRKIERTVNLFDAEGKAYPLTMELRFPDLQLMDRKYRLLFLEQQGEFTLSVRFGATQDYDVLTDPLLDDAGRDGYLQKHWRDVIYVDFVLEFPSGGGIVTINNAALRLFGESSARGLTTAAALEKQLADASLSGFVSLYRRKLAAVEASVDQAKDLLLRVRNLDEDYCHIQGVEIEDVAVCADVEVAPDADIDRVQALIWFEIEHYFNPPVYFYSLQDMQNAGIAVEDIFNGPALANGFIKADDLAKAQLQTELRTSDIINRLMDIDGVLSVTQLLLTGYDTQGHVIKGKADPDFSHPAPLFDPDKISASWILFIDNRKQPRFYSKQSRFLFYKNGLPFKARQDEALDTLTQLRGEAERPKIKNAGNDLPTPVGEFRNPEAYYPVQYSLPLTYGVGTEGLSPQASPQRKAQALQLKAYLMVFEQLLGNQLAQLANTAELFSMQSGMDRTYFVRLFNEELISGYDDLLNGLDKKSLEDLIETTAEFLARRNRFLDHLLARFGEQFSEYTLLLTDVAGQQKALELLLETKLAFLKALPVISRERYRSFHYREKTCFAGQYPVLKKRVSLLLGYPDWQFEFVASAPAGGKVDVAFTLSEYLGPTLISGSLSMDDTGKPEQQAYRALMHILIDPETYKIKPDNADYRLELVNSEGDVFAAHTRLFESEESAALAKQDLLAWSANERALLIEHILLRPKFPGDALYPVCQDTGCNTCGDEDPYSFRLTWVMPGWVAPYNENLELREFADRTIRKETPAHLLAKICWVGNNGFIENPCDQVMTDLAALLMAQGLTGDGERPDEEVACACASAIYQAFSQAFKIWYDDKTLVYFHDEALQARLGEVFNTVDAGSLSCSLQLTPQLWSGITEVMIEYFIQVVHYGWQFERFEEAWCRWLNANAAFDWTSERLQERVSALLQAGLINGSETSVCRCAAKILAEYGTLFYQWLDNVIIDGLALEELPPFNPGPVSLCPDLDFKAGTGEALEAMLKERYAAYTEVSYRLRIVLNLLAALKNTYPEATLHDCDDGSDQNPVLLDKTALGALSSAQRPFETL